MKHFTDSTRKYTDTPCPFCALLCDDLVITNKAGTLVAGKNACPKARREFNRSSHTCKPTMNGKDVPLEKAINAAAALLKTARQPMFAGLGTDVNGMRATLALADRTGGTLDHMHGKAAAGNIKVLQDRGWISTTLMEVKNRADLVILAGTDTAHFPRFFERVLLNRRALVGDAVKHREVIYIGDADTIKPVSRGTPKIRRITCKTQHIGTLVSALRALLNGTRLQARRIAGMPREDLHALCDKMRSARYGVIIWSSADLDPKHSDLTIQSICALINDLNQTTRFAGLPLGGHEGGMTAASVSAWQSGYPLKVSYGRGYPEYDPLRFSAERLLATGEADALVWISSIGSAISPPATASQIPTIALTSAETPTRSSYTVQIPVGTPGVDHSGQMIRCDSVVSLALRQLRETDLPSVASVLASIQNALEARRS